METKSIRHYGGTSEFAEGMHSLKKIIQPMQELRGRLGDKRGLLDEYVRGVLQSLSNTLTAVTCADDGFDTTFTDMRDLCNKIRDGKEDEAQRHPLYSKLKAYNDTHNIPQTAFFYEARCVGLFAEFSQYTYEKCLNDLEARMQEEMKKNGVPEARMALCAEIADEEIDHLFDQLMQCFIMISPAGVSMQAMLEQLVTSLLTIDKESKTHLFQSLLDGNI